MSIAVTLPVHPPKRHKVSRKALKLPPAPPANASHIKDEDILDYDFYGIEDDEEDRKDRVSDDEHEESVMREMIGDDSEDDEENKNTKEGDVAAGSDEPLFFEDTAGADPSYATSSTANKPTRRHCPPTLSALSKNGKLQLTLSLPHVERRPMTPQDDARLHRMILKYIKHIRSFVMRKVRRKIEKMKMIVEGDAYVPKKMRKKIARARRRENKLKREQAEMGEGGEDKEKEKETEKGEEASESDSDRSDDDDDGKEKKANTPIDPKHQHRLDFAQKMFTALTLDHLQLQRIPLPLVVDLAWKFHWHYDYDCLTKARMQNISPLDRALITTMVIHRVMEEKFLHIQKMSDKKALRQKNKEGRKVMQKEKTKLRKEKKVEEQKIVMNKVSEIIKEKLAEKGDTLPDNWDRLIKPTKPVRVKVGEIVHGVVAAAYDFGLHVDFFHKFGPNEHHIKVRGLLPTRYANEAKTVEAMNAAFKVGDRLRAVVVQLDTEITLTYVKEPWHQYTNYLGQKVTLACLERFFPDNMGPKPHLKTPDEAAMAQLNRLHDEAEPQAEKESESEESDSDSEDNDSDSESEEEEKKSEQPNKRGKNMKTLSTLDRAFEFGKPLSLTPPFRVIKDFKIFKRYNAPNYTKKANGDNKGDGTQNEENYEYEKPVIETLKSNSESDSDSDSDSDDKGSESENEKGKQSPLLKKEDIKPAGKSKSTDSSSSQSKKKDTHSKPSEIATSSFEVNTKKKKTEKKEDVVVEVDHKEKKEKEKGKEKESKKRKHDEAVANGKSKEEEEKEGRDSKKGKSKIEVESADVGISTKKEDNKKKRKERTDEIETKVAEVETVKESKKKEKKKSSKEIEDVPKDEQQVKMEVESEKHKEKEKKKKSKKENKKKSKAEEEDVESPKEKEKEKKKRKA